MKLILGALCAIWGVTALWCAGKSFFATQRDERAGMILCAIVVGCTAGLCLVGARLVP